MNAPQIVLLVTKAVGDFLGTNGIADEMIRFNGFPFLEKQDHVYNVTGMKKILIWRQYLLIFPPCSPVSAVMRKDLRTLTETGMRVKDVGKCLSSSCDHRHVILDSRLFTFIDQHKGFSNSLC
jgi:chloride channel 3/4/5